MDLWEGGWVSGSPQPGVCGEAGPLQNGRTQCLGLVCMERLVGSVAHVETCVTCEVTGLQTASEDAPVAGVMV